MGHPVIGALVIAYGTSFAQSMPSHMNLVDRLAAMSAWPDDPRAAAPLCRWLVTGEVRWSFDSRTFGTAARVVYELIAGELRRIGDARIVPALRACAADPSGDSPALCATQVELATQLADALAAIPPLPDALAAQIAACAEAAPSIARAVRSDLDAALWAEIVAHPTDDSPRLVLADALLDRGDPRGELIAMQCAGRRQTQALERALIEQHWPDWIGELAPILQRTRCEFRRGMLEAIVVGTPATPAGSYAGLRGRRELACVTTVRPGSITARDYAAVLDSFDRLDVVDLALPGVLAALGAVRARWTFRVVELRESSPPLYERDPADVIRELVALVPELAELRVDANLWTAPELRSAYLDELARLAPRVVVTLRAGPLFVARRHDGDDRLASLRGRAGVVLVEGD